MANLVLNGQSIDRVDEIAENFVEGDIVRAFRSGILVAWLEEYGYDDEASRIKVIVNAENLIPDIVKALDLDPAVVKSSQKRLVELAAKKEAEKVEEEKRLAELAARKAEEEKRLEELAAQKAQEESSISGNNSSIDALSGVGKSTEESAQGVAYCGSGYWIDPEKCVACGCCKDACPAEAISEGYAAYSIDTDKCVDCGTCTATCPNEAIQCGGCQNDMTGEPPIQIGDASLLQVIGRGRGMKYICEVCGFVYAPANNNGVAFEDIPDDWTCPLCGVGKDLFEPA